MLDIQFNQLTAWDYTVLSIGLVSIVIGVMRGIVRTLFGFGAWFFAVLTPLVFLPLWLPGGGASIGLQIPTWLIYSVSFLTVLLSVQLIGNWIASLLKKVGLGSTDRLLGGVLGAARALLVVTVLAVMASLTGLTRFENWKQAQFRPLLDTLVSWAVPILPERTSSDRKA